MRCNKESADRWTRAFRLDGRTGLAGCGRSIARLAAPGSVAMLTRTKHRHEGRCRSGCVFSKLVTRHKGRTEMLINLAGRRLYYTLEGPENGQVVCFTHSLASDGGMWAEQLPPLLAAGYRVLRLDMRGHGGSDPVAGPYTMAQLADDVAAALDFLGHRQGAVHRPVDRRHDRPGLRHRPRPAAHLRHAVRYLAADARRARRPAWAPRIEAVTKANSLEPLADPTMERWFTDAFKPRNPGALEADQRHHRRHHARRLSRLRRGHPRFRLRRPSCPSLKVPTLVVCGAKDEGTPPAGNKKIAELVPGAPLRGDRRRAAFPQRRAPRRLQPHHAGLARQAPVRRGADPAGRRRSCIAPLDACSGAIRLRYCTLRGSDNFACHQTRRFVSGIGRRNRCCGTARRCAAGQGNGDGDGSATGAVADRLPAAGRSGPVVPRPAPGLGAGRLPVRQACGPVARRRALRHQGRQDREREVPRHLRRVGAGRSRSGRPSAAPPRAPASRCRATSPTRPGLSRGPGRS